jgi:ATP-binding cassette subfamily B protein AbcA/BmrA
MNNGTCKNETKEAGVFKLLGRLSELSGKYVIWYIALVLAALALSAVSIADTEGIRRIVNGATEKDTRLIMNGVMLSVAVLVIGQLIEYVRGYAGELLDFLSVQSLQVGLLSKLTRVLMKDYDRYHTGDLIDRVNNSTVQIQTGINRTVVNILQNFITAVLLIIYLAMINFRLTLVSVIFAALLPLMAAPVSKKLRSLNEQSQKINADKSAFIQDVLQGSEVVRAYMLHKRMAASLDNIFD